MTTIKTVKSRTAPLHPPLYRQKINLYTPLSRRFASKWNERLSGVVCAQAAGGVDWYNVYMTTIHPKSVRRRLLTVLYERYLKDPLEMLTPEDVLADSMVPKQDVLANMHYLGDKGYVELMMGYNPPWFAAVRITAQGIDLVENRYEFNLHYPPAPSDIEETFASVPALMERLVEQADFAPLDGEERKCLLRDVLYLRDELARPATRWRTPVVETVIGWIEGYFQDPQDVLPVLVELRAAISAERE
ncbi:MAG: hypothetical protein SGI88_03370 [Candidatus Hydrogenedentes bacterium]|nr:hypothetical protein [Candidatus Hydrogenedentota bacterium]